MPRAEGHFGFVAWTDVQKTLALIWNLKTRRKLKCYVEYLHLSVGMVLKDEEEEREENE